MRKNFLLTTSLLSLLVCTSYSQGEIVLFDELKSQKLNSVIPNKIDSSLKDDKEKVVLSFKMPVEPSMVEVGPMKPIKPSKDLFFTAKPYLTKKPLSKKIQTARLISKNSKKIFKDMIHYIDTEPKVSKKVLDSKRKILKSSLKNLKFVTKKSSKSNFKDQQNSEIFDFNDSALYNTREIRAEIKNLIRNNDYNDYNVATYLESSFEELEWNIESSLSYSRQTQKFDQKLNQVYASIAKAVNFIDNYGWLESKDRPYSELLQSLSSISTALKGIEILSLKNEQYLPTLNFLNIIARKYYNTISDIANGKREDSLATSEFLEILSSL